MSQLTVLADFTPPVTRQTLYDMWNTAAFSQINQSDMEAGFSAGTVVVGSSFSDAPSSPGPGQLFWHMSENVMYCWHDEIDATGVSLWLAFGPDKFESAMLLTTVAAAGEAIELVGPDRRCQRYTPNASKMRLVPSICGFNQSHINAPYYVSDSLGPIPALVSAGGETYWMGETAVTNEWIRVAVDGIVYAGFAPGSHPTTAVASIINDRFITISNVPNLPAGIESTSLGINPHDSIIGKPAHYARRSGTASPTEPWLTPKIQFHPRHSTQGDYLT